MFTQSVEGSKPALAKLMPFEFVSGPDNPLLPAGVYSGLQPILMFLGGNPDRWLVCEAERDWRKAIEIRDGSREVQVHSGKQKFQKRRAWFFRRCAAAARLFERICREREREWAERLARWRMSNPVAFFGK